MPTHLPNIRHNNDEIIGLALSPKAAFTTYATSISTGAVAFAAVPDVMASVIAFTAVAFLVSDKMERRALDKGDVVIKTWKKPRWDIS